MEASYSAKSWELTAAELNNIESIWHGLLQKMITNGFKRKNVPKDYLKARKKAKYKEPKENVAKPDETITKTTQITDFCKIKQKKIFNFNRLGNNSLQKQILFTCEHKTFSSDPWQKITKELNLDTRKIQNTMQNRKRVPDPTI